MLKNIIIILLGTSVLLLVMVRPATESSHSVLHEVAEHIVRGEDRFEVAALSDRIIGRHNDFSLVDIRSRERFDTGHIQTAQHIPLPLLAAEEGQSGLPRDRIVVVYGEKTAKAAQAVLMLRLAGFNAYALSGGYQKWMQAMSAADAETDAREQAKRQAARCYFEGDYVAAAGLMVKESDVAGYTPPLQPVEPPPDNDPLGLGLGLDVESVQDDDTTRANGDPLGLGLGLGVESTLDQGAADKRSAAPAKLIIGEGC